MASDASFMNRPPPLLHPPASPSQSPPPPHPPLPEPHPRELPLPGGAWLRKANVKDRSWLFDAQELFSCIHISKAGGSTFIVWARNSHVFSLFYPTSAMGQEHGYLYDRSQRPTAQRLVLLRSPRAHVLSMFKECRYDH